MAIVPKKVVTPYGVFTANDPSDHTPHGVFSQDQLTGPVTPETLSLNPLSNSDNTVHSSAAGIVPLTLIGAPGQSVPLLEVVDSNNNVQTTLGPNGNLLLTGTAAISGAASVVGLTHLLSDATIDGNIVSSGSIVVSGNIQFGTPLPPQNLGDGQFGSNIPTLPNFYISNRAKIANKFGVVTNYHPGVSGSVFPRMVIWDDPLLLFFSASPVYHSGGMGWTIDKTDVTLELPIVMNFAVSGGLKWGYGLDSDTLGTGGSPDYVVAYDYSAGAGAGADILRGSPAISNSYGVPLWNWGGGVGTARGNQYFLTITPAYLSAGGGLGGLAILTSGGTGLLVGGATTAAVFEGTVQTGSLIAADASLNSLSVTGGISAATAVTTGSAGIFNAPSLGRCLTLNGGAGATIFMTPASGTFRNSVHMNTTFQWGTDLANNGSADFWFQNLSTGNAFVYCDVNDKVTLGSSNANGGATVGVSGGKASFYGVTPVLQPAVTGSIWTNTGPLSLLQGLAELGVVTDNTTGDPTTPSWTWVNQGSASLTTNTRTLYLAAPAASGDNIHARVIAVPAAPYTITLGFLPNMPYANFLACGLVLYNSVSGSLATFQLIGNSSTDAAGQVLSCSKWTNATTYSADYSMIAGPIKAPAWQCGGNMWLQIHDDGTTRFHNVSNDGVNFTTVCMAGSSDFIQADHIGFFVNPSSSVWGAGVKIVHWQQS